MHADSFVQEEKLVHPRTCRAVARSNDPHIKQLSVPALSSGTVTMNGRLQLGVSCGRQSNHATTRPCEQTHLARVRHSLYANIRNSGVGGRIRDMKRDCSKAGRRASDGHHGRTRTPGCRFGTLPALRSRRELEKAVSARKAQGHAPGIRGYGSRLSTSSRLHFAAIHPSPLFPGHCN